MSTPFNIDNRISTRQLAHVSYTVYITDCTVNFTLHRPINCSAKAKLNHNLGFCVYCGVFRNADSIVSVCLLDSCLCTIIIYWHILPSLPAYKPPQAICLLSMFIEAARNNVALLELSIPLSCMLMLVLLSW